jgi:SNF2 family DNA or RNA helicase
LLVVTTDSLIGVQAENQKRNALFPTPARFRWDCVVVDEAHRANNPATRLCKALGMKCFSGPQTFRLMLTATPMENDLKELYVIVKWATGNCILGTAKEFDARFATPIRAGREKNASSVKKQIAKARVKELKEVLDDYICSATSKTTCTR